MFPCFGPRNEAPKNTSITSSAFSAHKVLKGDSSSSRVATNTNNNVAYCNTRPSYKAPMTKDVKDDLEGLIKHISMPLELINVRWINYFIFILIMNYIKLGF